MILENPLKGARAKRSSSSCMALEENGQASWRLSKGV